MRAQIQRKDVSSSALKCRMSLGRSGFQALAAATNLLPHHLYPKTMFPKKNPGEQKPRAEGSHRYFK